MSNRVKRRRADQDDRASAEGLRAAAENVSDRRTLMGDGGFWVSRKEMRALDLALGRPDIGVAALRDTGPRPDSGIDVERLAEALDMPGVFDAPLDDAVGLARDIAREYDALSTPRTETPDHD